MPPPTVTQYDLPGRPLVVANPSMLMPTMVTPVSLAPQWYNLWTLRPHFVSQYSQLVEHNHSLNSATSFFQAIIDKTTWEPMEYWQLIQFLHYKHIWETALANELGHLSWGIQTLPGTNTIKFIHKHGIPSGQAPTYGQIIFDYICRKQNPTVFISPWVETTLSTTGMSACLLQTTQSQSSISIPLSTPHINDYSPLTLKISIWTCPWIAQNICTWNTNHARRNYQKI